MSIISPWSDFTTGSWQPRYQLGKDSLANRNGRGSMIPTNVRCIESTKAGKKNRMEKLQEWEVFSGDCDIIWTDVFINAHLRGNHVEGAQILFNSDSNSRSPSVCSSSGTWQLSKFGHRDPSWLSNQKRRWLFGVTCALSMASLFLKRLAGVLFAVCCLLGDVSRACRWSTRAKDVISGEEQLFFCKKKMERLSQKIWYGMVGCPRKDLLFENLVSQKTAKKRPATHLLLG